MTSWDTRPHTTRSTAGAPMEWASDSNRRESQRQARRMRNCGHSSGCFGWPRWATHVRLIYLERVSHADHDMAVAAAKDMAALETFTRAVQANPAEACQ